MAEGFGELGPGWGGRTGDGGATPGQGWPGAGPSDWVPPLTDAQIEAARARGLPIRLEDVIEARIKGRIAPGDEGLTNEEIARYNARAALAWEKGERAGPAPPRQRPRPRWRR